MPVAPVGTSPLTLTEDLDSTVYVTTSAWTFTTAIRQHKIESKKEVYAEKEHYIEAVFAVVKKQLLNFRKSEAYIDYLAKCATKANEKLGGLTKLYVTRTDLEVMKKIVSGVEVKQDLRIMLGGIIAENDGLTMDFSFDKKIRTEREKFEQKLNEL